MLGGVGCLRHGRRVYQLFNYLAPKFTFGQIYSIELDAGLCMKARERFTDVPNVNIIQGDSSNILPDILASVKQPCLFWLDGHYSGDITAKGDLNTPIKKELERIFAHPIKNHVILIDDARCFTGQNDYPTMEDLKKFVAKKRPKWIFEIKNDIIRIHERISSNIL